MAAVPEHVAPANPPQPAALSLVEGAAGSGPQPLRLNLGAGAQPLPGWVNLDGAHGDVIAPLPYPDNSVDEIRASHVLEHYSHRSVDAVVAGWVRALKPGGILRIAVPDFEVIARRYLAGDPIEVEGYVMGGQGDARDHHGAIFDWPRLADLMEGAGLVGLTRWESEIEDCASLPISLNLQGVKKPAAWPRTCAVMSVPRLGFMDNFISFAQALPPLGITIRRVTGAFWGQCLTRAFEQTLAEPEFEYVLTVDYDTVYTRADVEALLSAAMRHPEADAIAPLQAGRGALGPLFCIHNDDGTQRRTISLQDLGGELLRVHSAHFGLTLIRTSALRRLPRPWFLGHPDADGGWGEGRTDDDIHFWRQMASAGMGAYLATRVTVGHAELMIRWPDRALKAIHQHPNEFWDRGKPEAAWR